MDNLCTTLYRKPMQPSNFDGILYQLCGGIFSHGFHQKIRFNPLSAKLSFQVWYPGGQRLKVISFSWSGVKSPSKCFSNTESTTIIASRDEKRCYAAVQWNQIGALKFVTLRWPTPEVSRMTASLRSPPALQPDRPAAVRQRTRKQWSAKW